MTRNIKEFSSKEEMLAYEEAREEYLSLLLNAKNIFEFYKLWLREIFIPKYRKLNKEYEGYGGGWYRDKDGVIHAISTSFVDLDRIKDGDILIDHYNEVYTFYKNAWMRIY